MSNCKDQIIKTINSEPNLATNISKLTKTARWANKANCISELGGFGNIKDLIDKEVASKNLDTAIYGAPTTEVRNTDINNTTDYNTNIDPTTGKPKPYQATWSDFGRFMWRNTTQTWSETNTAVWSTQIPSQNIPVQNNIYSGTWRLDYIYIGLLFGGFGIFLWYFFRFVRFVFSILYDLVNADRMVYMNVILPGEIAKMTVR